MEFVDKQVVEAPVVPMEAGAIRVVRSRGSTGPVRHWLRSARDLGQESERWGQALWMAGLRPTDRLLVALPNADMAFAAVLGAGQRSVLTLRVEPGELAAAAAQFVPTAVLATPMTVYRALLHQALASVELALLTGEVGRAIFRIRPEWARSAVRFRDVYALTEHPGPLAVECPYGRLHWAADDVGIEFVEIRHGLAAHPGQLATVVVTNPGVGGMPLDHYDSGDLVRAEDTECPCAMGPLSSSLVLGRRSQTPWLTDRWLLASPVYAALLGLPGAGSGCQVNVRRDRGRGHNMVEVLLEWMGDTDPATLQQAARAAMADQWRGVSRIECLPPGQVSTPSPLRVLDFRG